MHSMISSLVIVASGVAAYPTSLNPIISTAYFQDCSFTTFGENDFATWPGPLSDAIQIDNTMLAYRLRYCSNPPKAPAPANSVIGALNAFSGVITDLNQPNATIQMAREFEHPYGHNDTNSNGRTIAITLTPIPIAGAQRQMTYTFNNTEAILFLASLAQRIKSGERHGDMRYTLERTDLEGPAVNNVASGSLFSV